MSEYLKLTSSWKDGLVFYAVKACKAKFGVQSSSASPDGLAIVRHKGSADCRAPRIPLAKESCVESCPL